MPAGRKSPNRGPSVHRAGLLHASRPGGGQAPAKEVWAGASTSSLPFTSRAELLAERGIEVDHVTVYRRVERFTPLFADPARLLRHATGDRWFVDETYVKVAGQWRYLYRAVDQSGQVIDVLLSEQRDTTAARRFFTRALAHSPAPAEVATDRAGPYPRVLDELVPAAAHITEQYGNNRIEADHGRLKARLRPMRGLEQFRSVGTQQSPIPDFRRTR